MIDILSKGQYVSVPSQGSSVHRPSKTHETPYSLVPFSDMIMGSLVVANTFGNPDSSLPVTIGSVKDSKKTESKDPRVEDSL